MSITEAHMRHGVLGSQEHPVAYTAEEAQSALIRASITNPDAIVDLMVALVKVRNALEFQLEQDGNPPIPLNDLFALYNTVRDAMHKARA